VDSVDEVFAVALDGGSGKRPTPVAVGDGKRAARSA
jgi:hypothetical protein